MKKIMLVFGTRPEAIKMCPLVKELEQHKEWETVVLVTGQHREMLSQVLKCFAVKPKYDLAIMKQGQDLYDITTAVLIGMRDILKKEQPDLVLVHGDTTTSFAAALAAFYMQIPVGHVEAGLRTYDLSSPFPEEMNRQGVGILATLHFAPTQTAKKHLLSEGKKEDMIYVTGNTVIDAMRYTVTEHYQNPHLDWAKDSRLILLTAHRRENLGAGLERIFRAVRRIVTDFPDVKVIYPVHKNPKVRQSAEDLLGDLDRIRLIEPLDVLDFHNFMKQSYLILSDSGGIQEEAPSLGKPVLVLRDTTERPEGVAAGTLKLAGTDEERIYQMTAQLLSDQKEYEKMKNAVNPYGDGHASKKIAEGIAKCLED